MMHKNNNPISLSQCPPSLLLTTATHDFMSPSGPSLVPIISPSEDSTSTFLGQSPEMTPFVPPTASSENSFSGTDSSSIPNQMSMIADSFGFDPQSVQPIPTYSANQFAGNRTQMQPPNPPPVPDSTLPASLPLSGSENVSFSAFSPVQPSDGAQSQAEWVNSLPSTPNMSNSNSSKPAQWHWFYRYFECTTLRSSWIPFSLTDSYRIEMAWISGFHDERIPTNGGRYDVCVTDRLRYPVYWDEKPSEIRRSLWFFRPEGERNFTPYDESVAQRLEGEYIRTLQFATWHRRLEIPVDSSGKTEVFVFHNPQAMMNYRGQSLDEYGTSGESARPCVVKRGVESLELDIEEGESQTIDHVIFVVHGIGARCDLRGRNLVECVDTFRKSSNALVRSHFQGHKGRVEYLPVHWHHALHGEATGLDTQLRKITLGSIPKLRSYTNDTLIDILFYTSPKYCQTIIDTVAGEINRLYDLFASRNPNFTGKYSIAGHSLGSVIAFDILVHQCEEPLSASNHDEKKPSEIRKDDVDGAKSICQMFEELQLPPAVVETFSREQIDSESLALLSDTDLKELDIPLGPRKKLMEFIRGKPSSVAVPQREGGGRQPRRQISSNSSIVGADQEVVNFVVGTTGFGQPLIEYPKLKLKEVSNFFAFGSPIALFLTTRGLNQLSDDFRLPTCQGFFNIFHPFDPVAYRMETMILPQAKVRAVLIPHHKGRKRMHLELKDSLARMGSDIKSRIMDSLSSTWRSLHQFAAAHLKSEQRAEEAESDMDEDQMKMALQMMKSSEEVSSAADEDISIGQLNQGRRIDFVLQESPLESFNDYIFALSSHACYWESEDTALMILKETYLPMGLNCRMPSSQSSLVPPPVNFAPPPASISPFQPPSIPPPPTAAFQPPPPPMATTAPLFPPPPATNQNPQSVFGSAPLLPRHGSLFRKK